MGSFNRTGEAPHVPDELAPAAVGAPPARDAEDASRNYDILDSLGCHSTFSTRMWHMVRMDSPRHGTPH